MFHLAFPSFQWDGAPVAHSGNLPKNFILSLASSLSTQCFWRSNSYKLKWNSLSHVWFFATLSTTVHGILQARIPESVAFPFSSESFQPRDQTQVSLIASGFFTSWATREAHSPVDLPNPGVQLGSPALLADSLSTELSGKANYLLPNTCLGDLLLREMYESSKYFFLIFCLWPYFDLHDLIIWENWNFILCFQICWYLCIMFSSFISHTCKNVYLFFSKLSLSSIDHHFWFLVIIASITLVIFYFISVYF